MLKKNCLLGLLVLMSCIVIVTNAMAAAPEKVDSEKRAFLQDKQRVQALAKAKDLDGLEKAAAKIQAKWNKPEKDRKLYGRLMLETVNRFASEPFGNRQRKKALAQKYAILALQAADELPIKIELELVVHLQADLHSRHAIKGKAWALKRTEQMKYWFHAYKRLYDTIDPKWDPKKADFTSGNVMPPHGVRAGTAGMSPSAIKDPKLRAQYEAAIEANRRKVEKHNQQYEARQLKKFFMPHAHRYIIQAYIHPPTAKAKLEVFLKKYVKEAAVRAKILNAVEKKKMPDDLILRNTTQPAKPKPTTQPAKPKPTTQPSEAK